MHAQTSSAKLKTFMTIKCCLAVADFGDGLGFVSCSGRSCIHPIFFIKTIRCHSCGRLESYVTSGNGQYFPQVFPQAVRNFGYAFDAYYPSLMLLPYVATADGDGVVGAYDGYQALILIVTVLRCPTPVS